MLLLAIIVILIIIYFDVRLFNKENEKAKLWIDHVYWTRLYMISELNDLDSLSADTNRLLLNQKHLAEAIGGDKVKTEKLLKEHILIASDIVKKAKVGEDIEDAKAKWVKNAKDIARHLGNNLEPMMLKHLELTEKELVALLSNDWEGSVVAFDEALNQILEMASIQN